MDHYKAESQNLDISLSKHDIEDVLEISEDKSNDQKLKRAIEKRDEYGWKTENIENIILFVKEYLPNLNVDSKEYDEFIAHVCKFIRGTEAKIINDAGFKVIPNVPKLINKIFMNEEGKDRMLMLYDEFNEGYYSGLLYELKQATKLYMSVIMDRTMKFKRVMTQYPIMQWMRNNWKEISTIIGVLLSGYKCLQWFLKEDTSARQVLEQEIIEIPNDDVEPKVHFVAQYDHRGAREPKHTLQKGKNIDNRPKGEFRAQFGFDENAHCIILKVLGHNVFELMDPRTKRRMGSGVFLKENYFMMNNHFRNMLLAWFKDEPDSTSFEIRNDTLEEIWQVDKKDLDLPKDQYIQEMDAVIIKIECANFKPKRDITKYWVTHKQISKCQRFDVKLVKLTGKIMDSVLTTPKAIENVEIGSDSEYLEPFVVRRGYTYRATSGKGTCGAILFIYDPTVGPGKILGLHAAGTTNGHCVSSSIVLEDILEDLKSFEKEFTAEGGVNEFPLEGEFVYLHKAKYKNMDIPKTQIIASRCHSMWGSAKTRPTDIRWYKDPTGKYINMKYKALNGYGVPLPLPDMNLAKEVAADYFNYIFNNSSAPVVEERKIIDFESAVKGFSKWSGSLNRQSSPGYPYTFEKPGNKPGKTYWFGDAMEYDLSSPQCQILKLKVLEILAKARNGERMEHVYCDIVKDERRTIEKIEKQGKIRMFSSCPMDYTIAFRMMFGGCLSWLMSNYISNGMCVGINPFSQDWDVLGRDLDSFSPYKVAGDFPSFDKTMKRETMTLFLDLVNLYYCDQTEEEKLCRETLWLDIVNSKHLVDEHIYEWSNNLPSGAMPTIFVGSFMSQFYIRYSYAVLHPQGKHWHSTFEDNVKLMVYGDDNIMAIRKNVISWFNQNTIRDGLVNIGVGYTPEDKDEADPPPFRSLSEITFLKRSFRYEPILGRMVAPLDIDSILEMAYWTKRGPLRLQIEEDNIEECLQQLSLHDNVTFDFWAEKVVRASQKYLHYSPTNIFRTTLLQLCSERMEIW